jgi:hypothetical protein
MMAGQRSQRHIQETRFLTGPPITAILPDTATLVGAGAVGRTVATLSITGGTAPVRYTLVDTAGLAITIAPGSNLITTTVNPYGTAGAKAVNVAATDARNRTLNEVLTVTVT